MIVNRGNEFLTKFREMIINDYSIKVRLILSRNPQAKHGTGWRKFIGWHISLHHFYPKGNRIYYNVLHSCPINIWTWFNNKLMWWHRLVNNKKRKEDLIYKSNNRENPNRMKRRYKQGDKVLLKNVWKTKFNQDA